MNLLQWLYFAFVISLAAGAGLTGCDRSPSEYSYTEITGPAPLEMQMPHGTEDPHAGLKSKMPGMFQMPENAGMSGLPEMPGAGGAGETAGLKWQTPDGWNEQTGTGMRLVTFTNIDTNQPVECTIVRLGPEAGEIRPNIVRWLGQINLTIDESALNEFLGRSATLAIKSGQQGTIFDLSELQPADAEEQPSMMGCILKTSEATIFVKMTGQRKNIIANKDRFLQLCHSLSLPEGGR